MGQQRDRDNCRGCGAALVSDARFCPKCGRSREGVAAPLLVDLQSAAPHAAASQTVVVASNPPDRRRMLALVGAAAALGLVALIIAKALDGNDQAAAPVPSTSTSLVAELPVAEASTSSEAATTTTTTASTSTVAPSTSTTAAPTTTTIPYVNQRQGVVLGAGQGDWSVYLSADQRLWRIELGTGRVSWRDGGGSPMAVIDGRLVTAGNGVAAVAAEVSGVVSQLGIADSFPFAVTDSIWTATYEGNSRQGTVRRFDPLGRMLAEYPIPAGTYPLGVLGDKVVISQYGRTWLVAVDAEITPYAPGPGSTASSGWVLWVGCDDLARCTYRLGSATTNDTKRTSLETTYMYALGGGEAPPGVVAPDGQSVVATTAQGRRAIIDLASGSVIVLGTATQEFGGTWTPDGAWFVQYAGGTQVVATSARSGQVLHLEVPGLVGREVVANIVVG